MINCNNKTCNMKKINFTELVLAFILLASCNNSNDIPSSIEKTESSVDIQKQGPSNDVPANRITKGDGITGEWQLVLNADDDNLNKSLDEDERKKAKLITRYYFRFNTDGSCLISFMKLPGRYEIKEENGKKKLFVYTSVDGPEELVERWIIVSSGSEELVLCDDYGIQGFWIFKRL